MCLVHFQVVWLLIYLGLFLILSCFVFALPFLFFFSLPPSLFLSLASFALRLFSHLLCTPFILKSCKDNWLYPPSKEGQIFSDLTLFESTFLGTWWVLSIYLFVFSLIFRMHCFFFFRGSTYTYVRSYLLVFYLGISSLITFLSLSLCHFYYFLFSYLSSFENILL